MKEVKRYMLDIETLGTYGCAVLLQVAVVSFDGKETFNVKFNRESQPKSITTEATIKWWEDKDMPIGHVNLIEGLKDLREFLKDADEVWSHNFDYDILFNVSREYGLDIPYHYRKFRDIRTLVALSQIDIKQFDWSEKTHDALDDCRFQIKYCSEAMRMIDSNMII